MKISSLALMALLAISTAAAAEGPKTNPPPSIQLRAFGNFDLKAMNQPQLKDGAASKAADTLREHFDTTVKPVIDGWKGSSAQPGDRTLNIQPELVEMHFVGGKARFWAGAFAGNSFVTLRIKLTDAVSGEVIGEPEFFQRANAVGGAWTVGKTDKDMLKRVVTLVANYLTSNYDEAIGGPTGRD
jgi:hypothetical protein